jgi:Tol biopolymer transport system component
MTRTTRTTRTLFACTTALLTVASLAHVARGQTIRASVADDGTQGDARSLNAAVSADGDVIAFESDADDLVPGDTNALTDVFVFDRTTNHLERVSVASDGTEGNAYSGNASLSGDGRYVAFESGASNLVSGDTNFYSDVFVRDRVLGTTTRVSLTNSGAQAKHGGSRPTISKDGTLVLFDSDSDDLVGGDTNGQYDVFLRDLTTGTNERESVTSNGVEGSARSWRSSMSSDGHYVVFVSDSILDPSAHFAGVFRRDRVAGTTLIASIPDDGSTPVGGSSDNPTVSDSGLVAFDSGAHNMVPHDLNDLGDVFVHDFVAGTTTRVSVASDGTEGDGGSLHGVISDDGQYVAFETYADNLFDDDVDFSRDVVVKYLASGRVRDVSIDSTGIVSNYDNADPVLSSGGAVVVFESDASNLVEGDSNGQRDVFAWLRGTTTASWSDYGTGFAGKNGIPLLTTSDVAALGTTITLSATNSAKGWTVGFLLIGAQADVPLSSGATLLVTPYLTEVVTLTNFGWSEEFAIPDDSTLDGIAADCQMVELDLAAKGGLSFSAGLELVIGEQ